MNLLNEVVEHIKFGNGVVTKLDDSKISVEFQGDIGTKLFQYPEAFEKFLKAINPNAENSVMEDLDKRLEERNQELKEEERRITELEERLKKPEPVKKKTKSKSTK